MRKNVLKESEDSLKKAVIFLKNENKPIKVDVLQKKVWKYGEDLETHTVETHIYRLRKKIIDKFKDEKFILNNKDGYHL